MSPDALTVVIDFRNVAPMGLPTRWWPARTSRIAAVSVEPTEALGAPLARAYQVAQPVVHHVRSERNTIVVDLKAVGQRRSVRDASAVARLLPTR